MQQWDTNTQSRLQGRLAPSASFLHIYIYLHSLLDDEEDEDEDEDEDVPTFRDV